MNRRWLFCLLIISLSGCAYENASQKITRFNPESDYAPIHTPKDPNSDNLVVVLAFSGGGTRAAALAFGVLEALDQVQLPASAFVPTPSTLLDQVDTISSVSGGSFTAAYYSLHGKKALAEFPEKMLYRRLGARIALRTLYPWNWF